TFHDVLATVWLHHSKGHDCSSSVARSGLVLTRCWNPCGASRLNRIGCRIRGRERSNVDRFDDGFVDLMDTTMAESGPAATRLLELLSERGWKGWTRFERTEER
ncbi:MAG: hypothetical protein ACTH93_07385, partial [Pseudoclavibacter sp.]